MHFSVLTLFLIINGIWSQQLFAAQAPEPVVYGVYRGVNLGNLGEEPPKDFYVSIGANHGIRRGSILRVVRRLSTYDVLNSQLYQDLTFPIAEIKVIHAEKNASVARLERMLPLEDTPVVSPQAIMVGDFVQSAEK